MDRFGQKPGVGQMYGGHPAGLQSGTDRTAYEAKFANAGPSSTYHGVQPNGAGYGDGMARHVNVGHFGGHVPMHGGVPGMEHGGVRQMPQPGSGYNPYQPQPGQVMQPGYNPNEQDYETPYTALLRKMLPFYKGGGMG